MRFTEDLALQVERPFNMGLGFREEAEILVRLPNREPNRRLDEGLLVELPRHALGSTVERGAHLEIGIGLVIGPSLVVGARLRQEIVLQEIVHAARDGLGLCGAIALEDGRAFCASRAGCLPCACQNTANEHDKDRHDPDDQRRMATRELLKLVRGTRRPGDDRLIPQTVSNIGAQSGGG